MNTDKEIKELEKHWRQSRRAIPVYVGMLLAAAGILWLLARFFSIPVWVTVIVLGLTAFTLIGDVINCFHCARKLRTLRHEQKG
jgi:hypothetical protein